MKTEDIVVLAVTLLILGEVTYLLAKLPKASIKTKNRAILVDTSVLMDGRIITIATSGFIGGTLVIPRSVVGELQLLADGSDSDKRSRARYGLDVVADLQKLDHVDVEILQDGSRAAEGVDERLLTLAKRHHAVICTLDFNLNKVAAVEGIKVLNINELAQGLRMSHLPGDHVILEVVQKGQDSHQGVGYLPDGTMVVVEQSSAYIGKTVQIEVIRSLQTAAGKMMFAKRIGDKKPSLHGQNPSGTARKDTRASEARELVSRKPSQKTPRPAKQQPVERPHVPQPTPVRALVQKERPQGAASQKTTDSTKPRPQVKRRTNRRTDHEADLIALVDKQS